MTVQEVLKKYGIAPNSSKDQHFMSDEKTIERMVSLAAIEKNDVILEIGAGIGTVTSHMAGKHAKIFAVEIDPDLFSVMEKEITDSNVNLVLGNALEEMDDIDFTKVISNTPYAICEPLMAKLAKRKFEIAVLSVPRKFSDILTSTEGGKNYSVLSVMAQSFFEVEKIFDVGREVFVPVPDTDTSVITIRPLVKDFYSKNPGKFILREVFLQRKKKLKNALMEAVINLNREIKGGNFTKNAARKIISDAGLGRIIEKDVEALSVGDFLKIKGIMPFP